VRDWVGKCELRAVSAERQKWIGQREMAQGMFLIPATSGQDFEQGMRAALATLGYELLSVLWSSLLEDAPEPILRAAQVAQRARAPNRAQPLPIAEFEPASGVRQWHETSWDELSAGSEKLWAIIDGVAWPGIQSVLAEAGAHHVCLYTTLNPESQNMAPWLALVEPGTEFERVLRAFPQSDNAYILLRSGCAIAELRKHFRRFTMLFTPASDEAPVYFRFYDPRVLLDAVEALRPALLGRLTDRISALIAPVSPLCLLPDGTTLLGGPVTPFTPDEACHGRLLQWSVTGSGEQPFSDLRITEPEFAAFSARMRRRSVMKLARNLHLMHGDTVGQERCLTVAQSAQKEAARYGLLTVKQVTIFARAMLVFGDSFVDHNEEVAGMLKDPALHAWQKKDRITKWFGKNITRAIMPV